MSQAHMARGITFGAAGRPLAESTIRVWQAVAKAGPRGIGLGRLVEELDGLVDEKPLRDALTSLEAGGYVVADGQHRWRVYRITFHIPAAASTAVPAWVLEANTFSPGGARSDGPALINVSAAHVGNLGTYQIHQGRLRITFEGTDVSIPRPVTAEFLAWFAGLAEAFPHRPE